MKISGVQKVFKPFQTSLRSGLRENLENAGKTRRFHLDFLTAKVLKDLLGHGCHQGQIELAEDLPTRLLGCSIQK